jgi:hypothetical protein
MVNVSALFIVTRMPLPVGTPPEMLMLWCTLIDGPKPAKSR